MIPLKASLRSYSSREVSDETALRSGGQVSLVQQHFRDEVDINTIVRRFGLTAELPAGVAGGVFGDFTDIQDYDDAMARIRRADEGFMKLPPDVRERFDNDPAKLIVFAAQYRGPVEFEEALHPRVPQGRSVDSDKEAPTVDK